MHINTNMDRSDNLPTNISQASTSTRSSDLTALKELHYTVSSGKTLIPVQIKVEPTATANTAITNAIQDVSNSSTVCPSQGISNNTVANTTVTSNSSIESPPLLTVTNIAANTSVSFSHELAPTTVTSSTDVSNTSPSSLSQMASTTAITTSIVSNTFTESQLLAHNSACSGVPITQVALTVLQEQNFRWGRKQVNALIDKVSEHFEEFYDHSVKKKEIWRIIAASMSQDGYKCTSSDCDKKWRNLKATYLKVLRKQILGGTDYRFEHFSQLHNILGKEIDPLGMREQALSDGKEQTVKSIQARQHSPSREETIIEGGGGNWSNSTIEHLLDLIQEECHLLNTMNANTAWERIAQQMNVEGHMLSIANCKSKWSGLKKSFNYYQQQASLSGSVPLWPFFTRVRHLLSSFKVHADETVSDVSHSKVVNSQVHKTGSMLERLEQIETEMSVTERLGKLEAQVEATQKIREARTQTNNLLQQVLLELRSITDSLEAENLHRQSFEHRIDPSTHMSTNGRRPQQQQQNSNNQPGIIIVEAYQDELT